MLEIALALKRNDPSLRVGILNPSDKQALRDGRMGMLWYGGHIALEEILAVQTMQNSNSHNIAWNFDDAVLSEPVHESRRLVSDVF